MPHETEQHSSTVSYLRATGAGRLADALTHERLASLHAISVERAAVDDLTTELEEARASIEKLHATIATLKGPPQAVKS